MNLIQGEKFREIKGDGIYYLDTPNVNQFLKSPPNEPFILISHNSDGKILDYDTEYGANINYIPNNLIRWYAQNVCTTHPKLESIPIGLENTMWFTHIKKWEKILQKSKEPKNNKNLLYVCHNIRTNPNERSEPYQIFTNNSWVTLEHGINGNNFDNYLNKIHSHKFVLCPEGNGTDTHRTWETLYVGSIPVEKRNLNNRFYQDLPMCFVDKWSDITEDFLNKEYERITNTRWNLEKLNFDYWKNKIK
jgi:hypothetical protein